MARLYDAIEPEVISMIMIQQSVVALRADAENVIPKEDKIDYSQVDAVRLDFRNILRMENLWLLTNLTKLQLDNNIIERIEGLETLTKLTWLDLSFNNISRIEGLECLTELTDLSLYNNRIKILENMDHLKKLNVFSIGNNQLDNVEQVRYLRRFANLRTLCLKGNPLASSPEYYGYTVSHLSQVNFLDYKLIDESTRQNLTRNYEIAIQQLITIENKEAEDEKKLKEKNDENQLYKDAFIENMDGDQLFTSLFADDHEGNKLMDVPGVKELKEDMKQKFNGIVRAMFEAGLEQKEQRDREIEDFWICVKEAKDENTKRAAFHVDEFKAYRAKFLGKEDIEQQEISAEVASQYDAALTELRNKLMALEITLVDQLEETIQTFERNMGEMVSTFTETMRNNVGQLREIQGSYNESLTQVCSLAADRVIKGELETEIDADTRELLSDKDSIANSCQTSDEFHRAKIDQREDEMNSRISNWMTTMMDNIHEEEEYQRNRKRIIEISRLIDNLRADIEDV